MYALWGSLSRTQAFCHHPFVRWPKFLSPGFIRNLAGLYLDTATSYLFPLITLPYLTRILGPAGYGTLAIAQSLNGYFLVIVDYGLILSGTREVARLAGKPQELGRLFATAVVTRLILATVLLPTMLLVAHAAHLSLQERAVAAILYLTVFAAALSPNWLYLGLERMSLQSAINVSVNLAAITSIFLLVRGPEHLLRLAWILAAAPTLGSFLTLSVAKRHFALSWQKPTLKDVVDFLRRGFTIFASQAAVAMYSTLNPFWLSLWSSREEVAFFAAGEKLIRALFRGLSPLWMALLPAMVHVAASSTQFLWARAKKMTWMLAAISGALAFGVSFFAPFLVKALFGSLFSPVVTPLRALSLLLVWGSVASVFTLQVLVPMGKDKTFTAIVFASGICNVLLAWLFAPRWGATGMAWAVVVSETLVIAGAFLAIRHAMLARRPLAHVSEVSHDAK